jgi:mono/diheme cytochrome c family protein
MKKDISTQAVRSWWSVRTVSLMIVAFLVTGTVLSAMTAEKTAAEAATYAIAVNKDSIESVKAFMSVYKVLMSPRCMNCHPSGDIPLQGDDSHLHIMQPRRGNEGKGVYAMKCANCHQETNTVGLHTPPGNPSWHLPPANMRMVFQGKTAHQLARQLIDPKQNGNKDRHALEEHVSDTLVKWGWNPGEGRTVPPLNYKEFSHAWLTWLRKGAYAPAP